MAELSCIIPFVNEWPMVAFTVRDIAEELSDSGIDFEIITIDNYCEELKKQQKKERDRAGPQLEAVQRGYPWLKALRYEDKLSHWQAKNYGVAQSTGKVLWFCDSHCMLGRGSLSRMYRYYKEHKDELNGTLHLPLTYHILEYHKLIYKLVTNWEVGQVHYSFTPYREEGEPPRYSYQVPCMSTCGMMMSRSLFDLLDGWPKELGIYGGGENFINFTMAVLGKSVNIFTEGVLHHHGDKRGYHWFFDDHFRNKCIATYLFGGEELAWTFMKNHKGNPRVLRNILADVFAKCGERRERIKSLQQVDIMEWAKCWGH